MLHWLLAGGEGSTAQGIVLTGSISTTPRVTNKAFSVIFLTMVVVLSRMSLSQTSISRLGIKSAALQALRLALCEIALSLAISLAETVWAVWLVNQNLTYGRLLQNPSRSPPTAAIARGFGRRKCLFDGRSMQ